MTLRVAILGAGPGGYVAAIRAAQLGAQVTLVERDEVGGTCLHWGCIPTKTLQASAELLDRLKRAAELGLDLMGEARPNMARLMARKREVIRTQAEAIGKLLKSYRIRHVRGDGRVLGPDRIRVDRPGGESENLEADRLILATGSRPASLPDLPFDGKRVLSSNHALALEEVPESILIVGGGVIGCEFASILSSLGARVVLVEALSRLIPIPGIEAECAVTLQREMRKRGVQIHLNRTVERADVAGGGLRVTIGPPPPGPRAGAMESSPHVEEVEKVLVSVGRVPNSRDMGLEGLGLELDGRGWVRANEFMETNVPHVYGVGDLLGPSKVMLAHVASAEGVVAAENAMGNHRSLDYGAIPSGVFTSPEVGCVGLSEEEARGAGHDARAETFLFRGLGKAQALGEIAGQAKLVWEASTGKILGVHLIGPHATDLIAEGTLALRMGATVGDLASTIHAHPTLSEVLAEAAHKAMGAPIHALRGGPGTRGPIR